MGKSETIRSKVNIPHPIWLTQIYRVQLIVLKYKFEQKAISVI